MGIGGMRGGAGGLTNAAGGSDGPTSATSNLSMPVRAPTMAGVIDDAQFNLQHFLCTPDNRGR